MMVDIKNWNDFIIFKVMCYFWKLNCWFGVFKIGFFIVNDLCYNSFCFGLEKGKGGNY